MNVDRTIRDIEELVRRLKPTTGPSLEQLDTWSATIGSAQGTGIRSSGHSDRTQSQAIRGLDPHAATKRDIEANLSRAKILLEETYQKVLVGIVKADADQASPPCISCQRERDHKGIPYYRAAVRANLCRWCWQWNHDHKAWPPLQILTAHHRGVTITPRLIARYGRAMST